MSILSQRAKRYKRYNMHRPYWIVRYGDTYQEARWTDVLLVVALAIALIVLVLFVANKGFEKRFSEVRAAQSDMQQELRAIQSELDQIEQTVADWHGIN